MFDDLSGVTPSQVNEVNKAHVINNMAIALLLIEKGIITDDELDKARNQATHIIDQIWTANQDQARKEFEEEHPGMHDFFKLVLHEGSNVTAASLHADRGQD